MASRNAPPVPSELDEACINTLRFIAVDAVQRANSGHPGLPLGAAPMAYVLWTRLLQHNPANPSWFDRDRFVLSAGHGSMLLYGLLHLTGYPLPMEELQRFRQWGSRTPGHPERGRTPGVEVTTGPLGQGFGNGVGMAIAERYLAARFNRPDFEIIDHRTYGLVSDGDLMEGVASEAASLAGQLRLGKLIYLYDDNRVSLAASTNLTFNEDRAQRFAAYGWHTQTVSDGNDIGAIERALLEAHGELDRPSLILVRTHIGYGSPHKHDTFEVHGAPLGEEETRLTKQNLGWPTEPQFLVPPTVRAHFARARIDGEKAEAEWNRRLVSYEEQYPELAAELRRFIRGDLPSAWDSELPSFEPDAKGMATRKASGKVLRAIAKKLPELIGGSADLDPSTYTALTGEGDFESSALASPDRQGAAGGTWGYAGRNLHFGVREHAMGAILNGIAAHGGLRPFGATFLIFSDYMRPPIRLAALMKLPVIYVFTHDSIGLGEDGPTHQPVEQLAGLRSIPDLHVVRPCDANETAVAWRVAIETRDHPVALVLSRQAVPTIDRSGLGRADGLRRGAYILADPERGQPKLIFLATGSEVALALQAMQKLAHEGVLTRVVSMPSWELFEQQTASYRDEVLPPAVNARLAIEAGGPQGWHRYARDVLAIARFGASAPGDVVLRELGFTADEVCARARALLARARDRDHDAARAKERDQ
jgi:transketolase